jgi:hypothetical protein
MNVRRRDDFPCFVYHVHVEQLKDHVEAGQLSGCPVKIRSDSKSPGRSVSIDKMVGTSRQDSSFQ